jgi:Inverse autotransporter, beta-domain
MILNCLLPTFFFCSLVMNATVVIAAKRGNRDLEIQAESSPSIHVTIEGLREKINDSLLIEGVWPLMKEKSLFLQGAWQRQQHRNVLSLGVGWRYFPETQWGFGCYLFYDQETTRQHRRLGWGGEAYWHLFKLAVNGYLPTHGWRTARDSHRYQQRPASGYDVVLQAYLPSLPQISASVRYAHYDGDAVALGGRPPCYRNPRQWRWGIDIIPIPLFTLTYQRQPGIDTHAEQQFSVTVTYRFSLPLSQQLDPQQVPMLYSVRKQRLARVQREPLMAAIQYNVLSQENTFRQAKALATNPVISCPKESTRAQPIANLPDEEPTRSQPVASPPEKRVTREEQNVISAEARYLLREWQKKSTKDNSQRQRLLLKQSIEIIQSFRKLPSVNHP